MADVSGLTSYENIQNNYEKYAHLFTNSGNNDLVNTETFFSLLMAEMSNQDPLEPTSNTEFVSQMAQFTSLQSQQDTLKYSMSNYASNLVGKNVTVNDSSVDGGLITGVCSGVSINGSTVSVIVNGNTYEVSSVKGVSTAQEEKVEDNDITKASTFIGKEVTVKVSSEDEEDLYDKGVVEAVEVQNGKPMLVIGDFVYGLDQVVLVEPKKESAENQASDTAAMIAGMMS